MYIIIHKDLVVMLHRFLDNEPDNMYYILYNRLTTLQKLTIVKPKDMPNNYKKEIKKIMKI